MARRRRSDARGCHRRGLWVAAERQTSSAQEGIRPTGPLISRGYTEAPAGTVTVAGNPLGGATLIELRIKDGQNVKRDEIIAVLSAYPAADIGVRMPKPPSPSSRRRTIRC